MKKWLASIFEDNSGGTSSIRVFMALWLVLLMVVWGIVALRTQAIPDIPTGVLGLTSMLVAGKVIQRYGEQPIP